MGAVMHLTKTCAKLCQFQRVSKHYHGNQSHQNSTMVSELEQLTNLPLMY